MKHSIQLSAGEWVEVRPKEEILATLDERGECDRLQFMPEMFKYCGRRFRVYKRAHKTCDTVNRTGGRRMNSAVHLEGLRCTGEGHGGCQAACLIFWKEAWLKRVPGPVGYHGPNGFGTEVVEAGKGGCTEAQVWAATKAGPQADVSDPIYACQATLLPHSTSPLKWWEMRQYLEDYTSGNVSLWQVFCGFFYMGYNFLVNAGIGLGKPLRWLYDTVPPSWGGYPYPRYFGKIPVGQPTPSGALKLQPGELVRVKPFAEILKTLNTSNKNKGMYFDAEEVPHCGKIFKVLGHVEQIIDERTGKMIKMKCDSVILEGAYCGSRYSENRLFCPRSIYAYWREIWLERVGALPPETLTGEASPARRQEQTVDCKS